MDQMSMNHSTKMQMHMSLYWGKDAIVLFSNWPNHSLGMYILCILFIFFLAMASEVLRNQTTLKPGANPIVGGLYMAIFHAFHISFAYLVMLAVMSFNLGIFIAAVVGHTLGFFFSKYRAIYMASRDQSRSSIITDKV